MRQLFGKTGGIPSSKISKGTARPLTENVMREGSWNIPSVIVGVAALLCLMNNVPAGAEQVSRAGGFSPGVSPPLLTEMSVTQAGSFDGTWVLESVELYRLSDSGAKTKVDNSNLPEQNAISGVLDKITFASGKCT
ncbi:MAG: hypothetical protein LBR18_06245, partial [Tannerella sp.]|nr:hypothetical protein [Tannerella sp.]